MDDHRKTPRGQKLAILTRIRACVNAGLPGMTHVELAAISPKYTNRISELRALGYNIRRVKHDNTQLAFYRELPDDHAHDGPCAPIAEDASSFYFMVGPAETAYVSKAYPTHATMLDAATEYAAVYDCSPGQFFWLCNEGRHKLRVGPLLLVDAEVS